MSLILEVFNLMLNTYNPDSFCPGQRSYLS